MGMLMINKAKMNLVYNKLVAVLYETFMPNELPGVSDLLTEQVILRKYKNDVLLLYVSDWMDLEKMLEGCDMIRIVLSALRLAWT